VRVTFRTARLKRCYEKSEEAQRRWGGAVGRRYVERVNILYAAESVGDLYKMLSLQFHPLTGDRRGQYALTLVGRFRLIVSIPDDDWKAVRVEEVSKHYGD
jgi:proteic killer suppression protein